MSKFNILYVENFPEIIGGGQRSLLGLLEKLDRELFYPVVVVPASGGLRRALEDMGVEVRVIAMPRLKTINIFRPLRTVRQMSELIAAKDIHLIHANGSRCAVYSVLAARRKNIPVIWHVRIADKDLLLDRVLARRSARIIAISEAVNRRFYWLKDRERRVKTIYNGIDLEKFNPSLSGENLRKEFGLDNATPLVGTVGRLDWYKGHKYLLRAARKVVKDIPECHFLIVGAGEKRKELERLSSALGLSDRVIFVGKREDIPEILASLDLFVLPSVSEGLGRAVIEAMAMEKAAVATRAGGIPEVVIHGETGILVPPKDESSLARAIIDLLNDRERAVIMGKAGRRRAEEKFDLNTNVEKISAVYLEVLTG